MWPVSAPAVLSHSLPWPVGLGPGQRQNQKGGGFCIEGTGFSGARGGAELGPVVCLRQEALSCEQQVGWVFEEGSQPCIPGGPWATPSWCPHLTVGSYGALSSWEAEIPMDTQEWNQVQSG